MHPALMKPIVKEFMFGLVGARHILNSVMPIASGFGVVLKRGDPFVAGVVVYSIEFLSKHCAIEFLRGIFALTKSSVSVKPVMIWHKR